MKKIIILLMTMAMLTGLVSVVEADDDIVEEPVSYTAYASDMVLTVGESETMEIVYTADGDEAEDPVPTEITYESDDTDIAVVSTAGIVTALQNGTANITAIIEGINGVSQVTCTVTVLDDIYIYCANEETPYDTATITPVLFLNSSAVDALFDFAVTGNATCTDSTDVSALTLVRSESETLTVTVSVSAYESSDGTAGDPDAVAPVTVYVSFYDSLSIEATVPLLEEPFGFGDSGVFTSAEVGGYEVDDPSQYSLLDLMGSEVSWWSMTLTQKDPDSTVAAISAGSYLYEPDDDNTYTTQKAEYLTLTCLTDGEFVFDFKLKDRTSGTVIRYGRVILTVGESVEDTVTFTDVTESDYYYDAVCWAVGAGVTNGTSATTFSPADTCTRAQVVSFLWRAAGEPEPEGSYMPFTDVEGNAYYYEAVLWAVEEGITTGVTATTFCPHETVTRGQVVTFLWRAEGAETVSTANPFTDVLYADYFYRAVLWAVDESVTEGLSATTFGPDNGCTRGQIVTFLYRACEDQ